MLLEQARHEPRWRDEGVEAEELHPRILGVLRGRDGIEGLQQLRLGTVEAAERPAKARCRSDRCARKEERRLVGVRAEEDRDVVDLRRGYGTGRSVRRPPSRAASRRRSCSAA